MMTSKIDDLIYDPLAGSGTTGAVCITHRRKCILSDMSDEYLTLAEKRLGIKRLSKKIIIEQFKDNVKDNTQKVRHSA